jgi:transcriptional regulator GlxA family with amidase domain
MVRSIAIVLFDDAEELDFVGPWEVFTMLRHVVEEPPRVFTVSETGEAVQCAKGMRVMADHSFANCPQADLVLVPGGMGTRKEDKNPAMLEFVRRMAGEAEVMTSVCTGSFVLAAAGLLEGKRATTHWGSIRRLRELDGITVVDAARYVDEGHVVTASGVSAGIDMALYLVGRLWDPKTARAVQKAMEYFPEPPYADVPVQE